MRDSDTDGHGDDRVPGHEHRVQCLWQLSRGNTAAFFAHSHADGYGFTNRDAKCDPGKSDTNAERDAGESHADTYSITERESEPGLEGD